jgi:hypothetical protein
VCRISAGRISALQVRLVSANRSRCRWRADSTRCWIMAMALRAGNRSIFHNPLVEPGCECQFYPEGTEIRFLILEDGSHGACAGLDRVSIISTGHGFCAPINWKLAGKVKIPGRG